MGRIYTDEQVDFLKANIKGRRFPEITEMLNKEFGTSFKESAIKYLVYRNGLGNGLSGDNIIEIGNATRFKKGNIPANKGTHIGGWEPTQFKKGCIPPNRLPIGSERIDSKDGYTYVKIQDGHLNKNWKLKHILIWEEHNGPVPKGHNVIFGDRDIYNFDINNLILVTKQQMLILNRHKLIQNDAELTRTGVILADLITKIHKRKNK